MANFYSFQDTDRQPYQVMFAEYLDELNKIDVERKTLDQSVFMHWHEFCELEFVVRGSAMHKFNNQLIPFEEGSLYLQLPTDFHEVLVDEHDLPEMFSVKFSEAFIDPTIYQTVLASNRQRQVVLRGEDFRNTLCDMEQLHREFQTTELFREHMLKSLVEKLVVKLERRATQVSDAQPVESPATTDAIRASLTFIQKNYHRTISLGEIAAHINMSPNYFSVYFRRKVGCTYRDYLKNIRMRFAISYLSNFSLPIYKISELVGYNNYEHFERTFRREFGVSPRAFREQMRQKQAGIATEINMTRRDGVKLLSTDGVKANQG